ncbi:hypothetical protein [Ruminococcus sp.]|jgi:putative transcriptional regulator|uniref:helix-turn-helix domain-containing protein n=1 Tax=Ruminococcus sp. TaxID=41978 RepID=UPI0025D924EB|nr:hypothetical protein [Ruminococcus sp.]
MSDYIINNNGSEIIVERDDVKEIDVRERVRAMRAKLALSQAKFAEKFSIPKRTIECWESKSESSRTIPNDYVLKMIETIIDYEEEINTLRQEVTKLRKQLDDKGENS